MQVNVLSFGVLKDWLGATTVALDLPPGATVRQLLDVLCAERSIEPLQGIAISVNAEYVLMSYVLHEEDEVALLPPVSGGCQEAALQSITVFLTHEPIPSIQLIDQVKSAADGAVVIFDGIVRNNTMGRQTLYLDYESYEKMALNQLRALAREAIVRFNMRTVTLVHRLGRLLVGETSVLIIVTAAHRTKTFAACQWLIDTLKTQVPIWKKETFADGAVWDAGTPFPQGVAL